MGALLMSAFGGRADISRICRHALLVTAGGRYDIHGRSRASVERDLRDLLLARTGYTDTSSRARSLYQLLHTLPFLLQTRMIDPGGLVSMMPLRKSPSLSH